MTLHAYDADGWLVGWHNDPARPLSTPLDPAPIPPVRARFVAGAWVDDDARERAALAAPRIAAAWAAADAHAASGMDANARTSLLWLAVDPACPTWRRERILAVQAWWSAVWQRYAVVRTSIEVGLDVAYDPADVGPCPFSIWQIAAPTP